VQAATGEYSRPHELSVRDISRISSEMRRLRLEAPQDAYLAGIPLVVNVDMARAVLEHGRATGYFPPDPGTQGTAQAHTESDSDEDEEPEQPVSLSRGPPTGSSGRALDGDKSKAAAAAPTAPAQSARATGTVGAVPEEPVYMRLARDLGREVAQDMHEARASRTRARREARRPHGSAGHVQRRAATPPARGSLARGARTTPRRLRLNPAGRATLAARGVAPHAAPPSSAGADREARQPRSTGMALHSPSHQLGAMSDYFRIQGELGRGGGGARGIAGDSDDTQKASQVGQETDRAAALGMAHFFDLFDSPEKRTAAQGGAAAVVAAAAAAAASRDALEYEARVRGVQRALRPTTPRSLGLRSGSMGAPSSASRAAFTRPETPAAPECNYADPSTWGVSKELLSEKPIERASHAPSGEFSLFPWRWGDARLPFSLDTNAGHSATTAAAAATAAAAPSQVEPPRAPRDLFEGAALVAAHEAARMRRRRDSSGSGSGGGHALGAAASGSAYGSLEASSHDGIGSVVSSTLSGGIRAHGRGAAGSMRSSQPSSDDLLSEGGRTAQTVGSVATGNSFPALQQQQQQPHRGAAPSAAAITAAPVHVPAAPPTTAPPADQGVAFEAGAGFASRIRAEAGSAGPGSITDADSSTVGSVSCGPTKPAAPPVDYFSLGQRRRLTPLRRAASAGDGRPALDIASLRGGAHVGLAPMRAAGIDDRTSVGSATADETQGEEEADLADLALELPDSHARPSVSRAFFNQWPTSQ